jgi:riboflavin synthase
MFTGLIEEVGTVRSVAVDGERARLVIEAPLVTDDLPLGASVAVDGVCVTATDVSDGTFAVDLMRETPAGHRPRASRHGDARQPRARAARR